MESNARASAVLWCFYFTLSTILVGLVIGAVRLLPDYMIVIIVTALIILAIYGRVESIMDEENKGNQTLIHLSNVVIAGLSLLFLSGLIVILYIVLKSLG